MKTDKKKIIIYALDIVGTLDTLKDNDFTELFVAMNEVKKIIM